CLWLRAALLRKECSRVSRWFAWFAHCGPAKRECCRRSSPARRCTKLTDRLGKAGRTSGMTTVELTGNNLALEQLYDIVHKRSAANLADSARTGVVASRAVVERCVEADNAIYGVNTGFGRMAGTRISREQIKELQRNLVRSHACGVGEPLSEAETRAM